MLETQPERREHARATIRPPVDEPSAGSTRAATIARVPFEPRRPLPPGLWLPVRVDPTGRAGPTRAQSRGKRWRRAAPGRYAPLTHDPPPEQRILDAACLLPATGAVTGWAALRLREAAYFDGSDQRPVPLVVGSTTGRREHPGLTWSYERLPPQAVEELCGLRVATPMRALFDELRCLNERAAVVAADMALAAGVVKLPDMRQYAAERRGWRRAGRAIAALEASRISVLSPKESELRLIWTCDAGLPPPGVNTMVFDLHGRFIGCADLLDEAAGLVVEYDGAEHQRARRRARDAARDEDCRAVGLEYTRVVAPDLHNPALVVRRLLAARERSLFLPPAQRRWTTEWPDGWAPW